MEPSGLLLEGTITVEPSEDWIVPEMFFFRFEELIFEGLRICDFMLSLVEKISTSPLYNSHVMKNDYALYNSHAMKRRLMNFLMNICPKCLEKTEFPSPNPKPLRYIPS